MDFFERQERARRNTKWLVLYFGAGVISLMIAVYFAVLLAFTGLVHYKASDRYLDDRPAATIWRPKLFTGVAAVTLAIIGIGSAYKTLELASGGSAVANLLGGRPLSPTTTDPNERKLLNVVEEMAIASGVPVPQVYVLPQEPGINAFAAGHTTSDAVVAVTEGGMKLLNRDELQGVIAHEFSHILNGDMRLNIRLMGIVFGILGLAVIGRVLLQTRGSSKEKNPLPLLGLALLLIGWIGVFFGRIIQAGVSRQREILADASAVQFTRNPSGLAGALKKIGGLSYGSKLQAAHAGEASHLFFGDGIGHSFLHLMDTHPPLIERIRALEPDFDGVFPAGSSVPERAVALSGASRASRLPSGGRPAVAASSLAEPPVIAARTAFTRTGAPTPAHLRYAEELRNAIPESLQQAAREPLGACTIVYALLLSNDTRVRSTQLQELAKTTSEAVCQETLRVLPQVETVAVRAKLPLVDLALPGLRQLSLRLFQEFRTAVQRLVESDGEIDLFEYVLQKIIMRHIEPFFAGARKPVIQYYALTPLARDCEVLLSAVARVGQQESQAAESAFRQGAQVLENAARVELRLVPEAECDLAQVDATLDRLSQAVPQIKKNVLNACALTVAADEVIQELEAELLRAIADGLDCPLPPFIDSR